MSTVLRRVAIRLAILAVIGGVIYLITLIPFSSQPKHFRIDRADVLVEVQPDAGLHVTERLTYDFTGDFSGAYRDIPLAAGVHVRKNVTVSEDGQQFRPGGNTTLGSYDRPGTFGTEQLILTGEDGGPTAGFRVVWHYSALDEERTFEVGYDVEGAATAYDDVVEVPWAVWGDQWEFWLDDLHAEIALADGTAEPVDAWLRPRKLGADPELEPGAASVDAERLQAGEVVLRAVFPRSAFRSVAGAQAGVGDGLEKVRAEEAEIDDDQGLGSKLAAFVGGNVVPVEILWTALVVGIAVLLHVLGRDRRSSAPRHLAEPPEEIPPALAYALAHEGDFDDRLVLATLLDLIDRDFYDAKPTEGKELDLRLSIPEARPADAALTEYEKEAVGFFDGLLDEGPAELGKLKDRIPQHSESWRGRWEKLREALDRAEEGQLKWERELTGARALLAWVALLGYVLIGMAYFARTHMVAIPIFATFAGLLFIYLLPASWLKRLDAASRERHAGWNAFARWTRDFPRLSDDPPATLKLWRRILVYAVAFGTAEKVIGSGRIPEPVVAEAVTANLWTAAHLSGMSSGFTPSFEGFASGFSSQVAPQASSSSSGGFSGGGGGFSGGGGGGAW